MRSKTAIITGASGDIGGAIAKRFAKDGYHLVLIGNQSKNRLGEIADECRTYPGQSEQTVFSFTGDLGDCEVAENLLAKALAVLQQVDLLVNCAGIAHIGLLADMSHAEWNHVLNTNLSSVFYCCRSIIPSMVHYKSGRILNISSVWGSIGASCEVAYSATKGAIHSLTKGLAKELAPSNIAVNALACGMIDTKMNSCFSEREIRSICDEIPAGRMGTPEEVADTIALLAEAPTYLTGQVITMDGGWC